MNRPQPPLIDLFERHGLDALLSSSERKALRRSDVASLPLTHQLEWLRSNRKVGFAVTLFVTGIRILFLGGAALTSFYLAVNGSVTPHSTIGPTEAGLLIGFGLLLVASTVWLGRRLWRRLRELRAPLPSHHELGLI